VCLPQIEDAGIEAAVWDTPLDSLRGRSVFDELLPPNHLGEDFRLRCGMLDPRWSKLDPVFFNR
jgi:hypothetical protein